LESYIDTLESDSKEKNYISEFDQRRRRRRRLRLGNLSLNKNDIFAMSPMNQDPN
jgi:hypothetical protein